jgi:hypothetical protein
MFQRMCFVIDAKTTFVVCAFNGCIDEVSDNSMLHNGCKARQMEK